MKCGIAFGAIAVLFASIIGVAGWLLYAITPRLRPLNASGPDRPVVDLAVQVASDGIQK
jgi:hypothetical protein